MGYQKALLMETRWDYQMEMNWVNSMETLMGFHLVHHLEIHLDWKKATKMVLRLVQQKDYLKVTY